MKRCVVKVAGEVIDLEELIRVCRRLGNHSELLRALFTAGEFQEVIALCRGPLRKDPYYGTLALARALFILGDYADSLEEWERYGIERWIQGSGSNLRIASCTSTASSVTRHSIPVPYNNSLTERVEAISLDEWKNKLVSGLSLCPTFITGQRDFLHAKHDCLAALVCLREVLGRHRLDEEEEIFCQSPIVYVSVLQNLGSWHSGLALLDAKYATHAGVARLQERLSRSFLPGATPRMLEQRALKRGPAGEKDYRRFLRAMDSIYRLWKNGQFCAAGELAQNIYNEGPRFLVPSDSDSRLAAAYLHSLLLAGDFKAYVEARRSGFAAQHYWPRLCDPYLNVLLFAGEKLKPEDLRYNYGASVPGIPDATRNYFQAKINEFEKRTGTDVLRYIVDRHSDAVYSRDRALSMLFTLSCRYNPDDMDYTTPMEHPFAGEEGEQLSRALKCSPLRNYAIKMYRITSQPEFIQFKKELIGTGGRDLANFVREFAGVPLVGEGWVSQRGMFLALKRGFAPLAVIAEASPPFLGGLRYDVYVPELRLAVEYQGIQHFEPVDRFGGEEGLRRTRERDELKARLSERNNVNVEYIRYDEDIQQRCQEIIERYRRK